MILRAGLAATHIVTFSSGFPDGDVTWRVLDSDGVEVDTGTVTPTEGSVSTLIPISDVVTSLLPGVLQKPLDVVWSYTIDAAILNGDTRYTVEARLPLGIAPEGVRRKLGVSDAELPDSEISLAESYLTFIAAVTQEAYDEALDDGLTDIRIRNAVEARAALALVPTMPIRVASSESSGTNEFKREKINWAGIAAQLETLINEGFLAVDPNFSIYENDFALFILASPSTDPYTGAQAT